MSGVVDRARERAFVAESAARSRTPLVPEISLRLATETTALWLATEEWLEERGVPPPFWAFAWAGGQALARYVLDHPPLVRGKRVVDFGTGGGVVALAAALAGAREVVAVDRDPIALAACELNAEDNGLAERVAVCFATDVDAAPACEVLLAGDVFYDRTTGPAIVAALERVAARGTTVYVGCPGRLLTPTSGRVLCEVDVSGVLELEGRETTRTQVLELVPGQKSGSVRMGGA